MPETNLPDALLKIGLAIAKHHIKNVIGDEALEVVADTMADVGGEKVQAKVDSIFASKVGQKELLKAAKSADEKFKKECKDNDLRQLFSMQYGNLPSVQEAIGKLPEALDDETLRETLFTAFRNDAPRRIGDKKINEGVNLYIECLQSELIPVKDFGLRIIHNALREIGEDVKDIKAGVMSLLEKTTTGTQSVTDSMSYTRFLVPFPHNPDFVGRDADLATLHEMLQQSNSPIGIRPTVLVGLGGIGKTQLAVEYAHAYRDDYPDGVFWLNAINPLLIEFSDLAEKLEMADRDTPRDKAARKVWDYLDAHPDALVIFDNVLEPSELNIPFSPDLVPANLRCRTLFTTRQRDLPRTFQSFEVRVLPEMAAMRLLLRSRPKVLEEHHPEWSWARIICASLGWLPLALELAAAYLDEYPEVSIVGYLERLRNEGSLETIDQSEVRALDLPTRVEEILKAATSGNLEKKHQVAVSATLRTQWNRLDNQAAQLMFRAAGQFPEASWIPIPRLGLLTGIESEANSGYASPLGMVLKKLYAVSLIEELSEDRLRLHPLVNEFASGLSSKSFRLELAKQIVISLYDFSRLQSRVIRYGIYTVIEDVRTGLRFLENATEDETYQRLYNLDRALDRIAHHLSGWNPAARPSFMMQELYNATILLNLQEIKLQAEKTLAENKFQYLLHKSTSHLESQELLRTLVGHSKGVRSVAVSADGKVAISGAVDNTLIIWDLEQGVKLHTLQCTAYDIEPSIWDGDYGQSVELSEEWRRVELNNNHVDITADGRLALSVSTYRVNQRTPNSGNAIVWDVKTGHELRRFFCSRAVLIEAGTLVYCEEDIEENSSEEDIEENNPDEVLDQNSFYQKKPTYDRKTVIRIRAQVLDIVTGHEVVSDRSPMFLTEKHFRILDNLSEADGRLIISSMERGAKLLQWRAKAFDADHSGDLYSVAISDDGHVAVSAMPDNTLKVWDVRSGQPLCELVGHLARVNDVAMSADGRIVVSASNDETLKVWDISTKINEPAKKTDSFKPTTTQVPHQSHKGAVNIVAISADGSLGLSASDVTIKLWDVLNATELRTYNVSCLVNSMVLSDSKRLAILGTRDKNIKIIDINSGQELHTLDGHGNWVNGVSISSDERIIVSASADKTLKVWSMSSLGTGNYPSFDKMHTLRGHTKDVVAVALSKDGRLGFSASLDYTLKLWDIPLGKELKTFSIISEPRNVALSADGQIALSTANRDTRIRVWHVLDGQETHSLNNHNHGTSGISINGNGYLAASTIDKILNVWNVTTSRIIATYRSKVLLTCCAMSKDGTSIIAGDVYGGIHFLKLFGIDKISLQGKA